MKRRKFIENSGKAVLACCVVPSALLTSCGTGMAFVKGEASGRQVILSKAELSEKLVDRTAVIVNNKAVKGRIYLAVIPEGYSAISMVCTHKGCGVSKAGDRFVCPCHSSEFSLEGEVLASPATENLQKFKVEETDQSVIIHI